VKRAISAEVFADDPIGHYWLGDTQLVWCRSPTLCGSLHWGTLRESDVVELMCALELTRHPELAGRVNLLVDARAVTRVDWMACIRLSAHVRERALAWNRNIRRQAVVVRPGPTAAQLASMAALAGLGHEMCFVEEHDIALGWLDWPTRLDARAAVDEAARLVGDARGLQPVEQRLRSWLEHALIGANIEDAAGALAMSVRSLQRDLCKAGTSFTSEVQSARVRVACELLRDTDDKIEVIARAVGSTSASQLSLLFRRQLGVTPARYRAQHATKGSALELDQVSIAAADL
jgi:AraC-like DNA-binding protein